VKSSGELFRIYRPDNGRIKSTPATRSTSAPVDTPEEREAVARYVATMRRAATERWREQREADHHPSSGPACPKCSRPWNSDIRFPESRCPDCGTLMGFVAPQRPKPAKHYRAYAAPRVPSVQYARIMAARRAPEVTRTITLNELFRRMHVDGISAEEVLRRAGA
jgi:DNA-directed RNA polymerase subunit RPC12/RpoP